MPAEVSLDTPVTAQWDPLWTHRAFKWKSSPQENKTVRRKQQGKSGRLCVDKDFLDDTKHTAYKGETAGNLDSSKIKNLYVFFFKKNNINDSKRQAIDSGKNKK